ncbi:MAG: molybdopterin-guanine dinucleotide biosynthesis protein B, partial [Aeromonas sp.]
MPYCPTELATPLPVLAISAWSGTGKTTLLEQVIPQLVARGIRLAVIKHAHHDVNLDQPGKDSWRLREAGASEVLLASDKRIAWLKETPESPIALAALLERFNPAELDLVLVEGFKDEPLPRLV